jgi:hypothetical protein
MPDKRLKRTLGMTSVCSPRRQRRRHGNPAFAVIANNEAIQAKQKSFSLSVNQESFSLRFKFL